MNLSRIFKHMLYPPWLLRRYFSPATLNKIEVAVQASESRHGGEIRFAVESALDYGSLFGDKRGDVRGVEVFSELRVWDTSHNNGVLIYLLLADRDVEIVADRGINDRVYAGAWEGVCLEMERCFAAHEFERGVLEGIAAIDQLLIEYFPLQAETDGQNELPNQPVIL